MAKEKAGCWCCRHYVMSEGGTDCGICSMAIVSDEPELEEMADAIRSCDNEPCDHMEYDDTFDGQYDIEWPEGWS